MPHGAQILRSPDPTGGGPTSPKIQAFSDAPKVRQRAWVRQPTKDGTGATHMKTFHTKLTNEALQFLDEQINAWLDEHTELEVKFVQTAVGEWIGDKREQHLIVQVWV